MRVLLIASLLTASSVMAADVERERLLGTWEPQNTAVHEVWTLESDGSRLHIVRTEDGKTTLDLECVPNGSECMAKDEGKKAKITMYFNGAVLVQFETRDGDVTRRKFEPEGDRMKVEEEPLTGSAKTHSADFARRLRADAH
jgi:hypothetical protein